MSIEQTYELCCHDARAMLVGIGQGRLRVAEERLRALRHHLGTRQPLDSATARGASLLRSEQLEALDGAASELTDALATLDGSMQRGLERVRFAADLVRHLTAGTRSRNHV